MANQACIRNYEAELEASRWSIIEAELDLWCRRNQVAYQHVGYPNQNTLHQFDPAHAGHDRILLTLLFDRLDCSAFDALIDRCDRAGKKLFVITDSWIDTNRFAPSSAQIFAQPELLGLSALPGPTPRCLPQKRRYNALIHRAEPVRQSWLYFLHLRDLLQQGFVSYRLYQHHTPITGQALFDHIHDMGLAGVPHFDQAHAELRHLMPYSNFQDYDIVHELLLESKYTLVLDSYAPDDDAGSFYVSEKITRALQLPTILLPFVQRGTLHKLLDTGLEIEPALLDIDALPWIDRQTRILEILEKDLVNTNTLERFDRARHNHELFTVWLEQCQSLDFYQAMFDEILS